MTDVTDRISRWICIYPAYLNAAKTRAEGRHIAKKDCVVNPTYLEIRDVLATAGLAPIVENKKHPRERSNEIEFRGRIRVQLKNEDGTPFKEEFKTRELTLMYIFIRGAALHQWSLPTVDRKISNFISVHV